MFKLRRICDLCPFAKNALPGWLGAERAADIAGQLVRADGVFHCHKTVDYDALADVDDEAEDTGPLPHEDRQFCAGALWLIRKEGGRNAVTQIAERLAIYDPNHLLDGERVVDSETEFISIHSNEALRKTGPHLPDQ